MIGLLLLTIPVIIMLITSTLMITATMQCGKAEITQMSDYPKFAKFIDNINTFLVITMGVSTVVFIVYLMGVGIKQTKSISFVKKYEAVAAEYDNRSSSFTALERIALFKSAAEMTGEAAVLKYWNKHFDLFITDEVDNLKPIR